MFEKLLQDNKGFFIRSGGGTIPVELLPGNPIADTAIYVDRDTIKQKKKDDKDE